MNVRLSPARTHALLLLIAVVLLPSVQPATAGPVQGGRKPRPGAYLLNDWAGQAAAIDWAAGSAVRVGWRDLEPQQGQYTFDRIDGWLAQLKLGGKPGSLELRLSCGAPEWMTGQERGDLCAPEWALGWDPRGAGDRPALNTLDGRVTTALAGLANSLARRYASDARLSHVIVGLGYDGSAAPCTERTGTGENGCGARPTDERSQYIASGDWAQYLVDGVTTFADAFERSGGDHHVPLLVTFTGDATQEERAALVRAAVARGVGLHDDQWAASFHTGDFKQAGCAEDASVADSSHWETIAALAGQVPLAVTLREQPRKSELALTDEENAWWSALNALDKGAEIFYVATADVQWSTAWRYFSRFAGKGANAGGANSSAPGETAAWIALRGAESAWCGDAGDYQWRMARITDAAGASFKRASASQPGGRTGETWRGAYTRSTDLGEQRPALYFDVDDALIYGGEHIVLVEVAYFDGDHDADSIWELRYDSTQGPSTAAGEVRLQGSGKWLVHAFVLTDAALSNRLADINGQPGGDLGLVAHRGDVTFHMISLRVLPGGDDAASRIVRPAPERALLPAASTPVAAPLALAPQTPVTAYTPDLAGSAGSSRGAAAPPPGPTATPDAGTAHLSGAVDTYLDADLPDDSFGAANNLVLRGDGGKFGLLRFDLSSLPADTEITAAWLELAVLGRTRPAPMQLSLTRLPTSWEPALVTWNNAGKELAAKIATSQASSSASLPGVGSLQIPITEIVQGWIAASETNQGLALVGHGEEDLEYYIASSEWRGVVARPRLRVRFADGVSRISREMPMATPSPTRATPAAPGAAATMTATQPLTNTLLVHVAAVAPDPVLGEAKTKVTVYVHRADGSSPACVGAAAPILPELNLWVAAGQHPAQLIAGYAQPRLEELEGRTFPVWEFTDVDLAAVRQGEALLHLFATTGGSSRHNVVTVGEARGTDYPSPAAPLQAVKWDGGAVDASLEILWPQDGAPLDNGALTHGAPPQSAAPGADKANLSVALFKHGTREVLHADADFKPIVRLHWSLNDGPDLAGPNPPVAVARLVQTPWLTYYLWEFPDVDIRAARQSGNYLNFWAEVEGASIATTNIWSHGYGPHPAPLATPPPTDCR